VILVVGWTLSICFACDIDSLKPCPQQIDDMEKKDTLSATLQSASCVMNSDSAGAIVAGLRPIQFGRDLFSDQKAIWTSPKHLRSMHLQSNDRNWIVLFGAGTLGLVAADKDIMRHIGSDPAAHSNSFGNYGLAAMIGTSAGFYLRGFPSDDDHASETGLLAGEAAVDSVIVAEAMKFAFQRSRPNAINAGSFGSGGASFPSEHAFAAWSVASVIAHEYSGPMTKFLAYGAASAISFSRIAAREHFPSDVVVGSALGYLIGRYVYRAHHDPELPGTSMGTFTKDSKDKAPSRRRAPAEFGSPSVPLDSWVYAAFDRLAGLGYAPSAYSDMRPWTRMECARIITAARDDLHIDDLAFVGLAGDRLSTDNVEKSTSRGSDAYGIYETLKSEFADELARIGDSSSETSEVEIESLYTRYLGIVGTPLDDGYHFGQTLINDYGRLYGGGANVVSGGSASGSEGPLAFYVRGEFQHAAALPAYSEAVQQMIGVVDVTPPQDPIHATVIDQFHLLDAYVAWNFKSIQLSAGRQSLWWGPGSGGAPNLSDNAQPMDMLRLTNPSPWTLPSFLHWLGPVRWDFFFGLMAGHHYPPTPAIDGQKISFKPTPNLEFGFSRTIVFRPITTRMFLKGFFSLGDNKTTTPGSAADVGDRRSGFDFSYRIPGLRNWLVLYNDGMTDDETSPIGYPQMSLMNPGIYLPRIPRAAKVDFRAEVVWSDPPALSNRHGQYFYYNGAYHDSYTNDGHLLGSWVGREGHGIQLWSTYWFSPRNSVQVGYRKAHVDRDFIPEGGDIQDFFVRATLRLRSEVEISSFLQYERWNFPVLAPLVGPDTVASIEFTYHPRWMKVLRTR
jgi:membrane-associated phospholipid phosphatase